MQQLRQYGTCATCALAHLKTSASADAPLGPLHQCSSVRWNSIVHAVMFAEVERTRIHRREANALVECCVTERSAPKDARCGGSVILALTGAEEPRNDRIECRKSRPPDERATLLQDNIQTNKCETAGRRMMLRQVCPSRE